MKRLLFALFAGVACGHLTDPQLPGDFGGKAAAGPPVVLSQ